MRIFLTALLIMSFILSSFVYASDKGRTDHRHFLDEIKKTVVFIGLIHDKKRIDAIDSGSLQKIQKEDKIEFVATGILVRIQNIYHLITAKHVVEKFMITEFVNNKVVNKLNDVEMYVFFNRNDKKIGYRSIGLLRNRDNYNWIFHDNSNVDIAIIPFGLDVKNDDVVVVPDNLFMEINKDLELEDVYYLSFQPGLDYSTRISPISRKGMISRINEDQTFYIDGFAFPGNSGCPVFIKPTGIRYGKGGFTLGGDQLGNKFLGIIGEYVPYQEVAFSQQTKRARVVFEENTGLSKVWSVKYINEIINSPRFKKQIELLKPK